MPTWENTLRDIVHVLWPETIRRKIIAFALLATLIPSLTMGWLSYAQHKQILVEKTSAELRNATAHTARELNLWLRERRHEAKVFSNSYEVTENLEKSLKRRGRAPAVRRLQDYLKSVRVKFADYEELLVVDSKLRVIATSARKASAVHLPANWFGLARADAPIVGDPHWDDQRQRGVINLGVPVRTSNGRLLGLLIAKLNFRTLKRMLETHKVNEIGRLYVMGADGSVVLASLPLPEAFLQTTLSGDTARALFEHEGSARVYNNYAGTGVIGMLMPVNFLGWGVVAEINQDHAFAQSTKSRNLTLLIVACLVVGIGSMAYLLGHTIVRPVTRLTNGAAEVAAGDLDVDLPVVGGGEVGYLTQVFNNMVARLRQSREELAAINMALSEKNTELERLSVTDSLTGLYNRKHLMETLTGEANRARRHDHSFCIIMTDIDHFKSYNDTHGHVAGDRVLIKVSSLFRDLVRTVDYVARYGGEEFLIMLPETGIEAAVQVAERIRSRVAKETKADPELASHVTLSMGVSCFPTHGDTPVAAVMSADSALYEAKHAGRNQVKAASTKPKKRAPARLPSAN